MYINRQDILPIDKFNTLLQRIIFPSYMYLEHIDNCTYNIEQNNSNSTIHTCYIYFLEQSNPSINNFIYSYSIYV